MLARADKVIEWLRSLLRVFAAGFGTRLPARDVRIHGNATPKTREAQSALRKPDGGTVFFSGEALYAGRDMGTVEAALASGRETAQTILAAGR
jgi:hypothetical protein